MPESVAYLGTHGLSLGLPMDYCYGEVSGAMGFIPGEHWLFSGIIPWWWFHPRKFGLRLIGDWFHPRNCLRRGFTGQIYPQKSLCRPIWGWYSGLCSRFWSSLMFRTLEYIGNHFQGRRLFVSEGRKGSSRGGVAEFINEVCGRRG